MRAHWLALLLAVASPVACAGAPVRIAFLGDIVLSRRVALKAQEMGWPWMTDAVKPALAGADLVVANLESPAGLGGVPYAQKEVYLRASPSSLEALKALGVGVVSLANNHILDYGPEVLTQTLAGLDGLGIAHCGVEEGPGQAQRPALARVRGLRFAFLGYCSVCPGEFAARGRAAGVAVALPSVMRPGIRAARAQADLVVVMPHWGQEYWGVNALQRKLAASAFEAGADWVVGSHPHVLQQVRLQGKNLVAFSLGNFMFDLSYPVAQDSAILWVTLEEGKPPVWSATPLDLSTGRPVPMEGGSQGAERVQSILDRGYEYHGAKAYPEGATWR